MRFIKFMLIWVSQQLAIPFWMVGHFHLSLSWDIYNTIEILFASIGMNVVVAVGFWLDWKEHKELKIDHIKNLTQMINNNTKKVNEADIKVSRIMDEISNMKIYK
tara:strand:+ start:698 stop:1012 length:315 start_codon:yes stop_codon:yes gene_type:complete